MGSVFGEETLTKLFSPKWQERDEELIHIEKMVKNQSEIKTTDKVGAFLAFLGAASFALSDNVNHVAQSGFNLLWAALESDPGKIQGRSELSQYCDFTFQSLLEKMNKFTEKSEKSFLLLCKTQAVGAGPVIHFLSDSHSNPKIINSHKHLSLRIQMLKTVITTYKVGSPDISLNSVTDIALKNVEHPSKDVRAASLGLLEEIYKQIGEKKFKPFLDQLKPAQQEVLYKDLGILDQKKKKNRTYWTYLVALGAHDGEAAVEPLGAEYLVQVGPCEVKLVFTQNARKLRGQAGRVEDGLKARTLPELDTTSGHG